MLRRKIYLFTNKIFSNDVVDMQSSFDVDLETLIVVVDDVVYEIHRQLYMIYELNSTPKHHTESFDIHFEMLDP